MQNANVRPEASAEPIVYVVDDDEEMREALLDLFLIKTSAHLHSPAVLSFSRRPTLRQQVALSST